MEVDANLVIAELCATIADLHKQIAILKVLLVDTKGAVEDG